MLYNNRSRELIEEVGEQNFLEIVKQEYVLQEWESNLPTPKEVFEAFENKFTNICKTYNYSPIFKLCMLAGFETMKQNNYSGFEIRLAMGSKRLLRENFEPMEFDEQIQFIYDLTTEWCELNRDISNIFPLTTIGSLGELNTIVITIITIIIIII